MATEMRMHRRRRKKAIQMILEKDHSDQRGALSLLCACVCKSALLAEEIERQRAVRSRRVRRKIFDGSFEWWRAWEGLAVVFIDGAGKREASLEALGLLGWQL